MMDETRAMKVMNLIAQTTFDILPADTSAVGGITDSTAFRLILAKIAAQGSVSRRELPEILKTAREFAEYVALHEGVGGTSQ